MKIREFTNHRYKITPIKMANDCKIDDVDAPLPAYYNFFMIVVGRPNSGKSTLWLNWINKRDSPYYKKFDRVYIFSNSLQTITTKIKLPEDRLYKGISQLEEVIKQLEKEDEKVLMIIDDCIADIKNVKYITELILNRRHIGGGISLIITTQVYNLLEKAYRKCASELVLFQTTNKEELESIYKEYSQMSYEDFKKICRYCFKKDNHEFIFINTNKNLFYHNFNLLEIDEE